MKNKLTVIGAGLTGPLLASILAKNNFKIDMYERANDITVSNKFSGRSINLALSKRGIEALKFSGVYNNELESKLIPMRGRSIHSIEGEVTFQPYGNKSDHYINSVSRQEINKALIESAKKLKNVSINFNMQCDSCDVINQELTFNSKTIKVDGAIIGSDGYKSVVAKNITDITKNEIEYINIEHSYKELTIKPKKNEFQLDPNSLHIWPRRDMMMIALPNLDKSFTCTLFMKNNGENSFKDIQNNKKLNDFFNKYFCDTINLIDNLEFSFFNNPTGKLIGIRVPKWNYNDRALVLGDAAHATVPFYGQGMNASFEDCQILGQIIDKRNVIDWKEIFEEFYTIRKKDGDALLNLSLDNYKVMRNDVLNDIHIKKQKLSFLLNNDFPDNFIPLYTMVSFTTIPYQVALDRGKVQDMILSKLINDVDDVKKYSKRLAASLIQKHLKPII